VTYAIVAYLATAAVWLAWLLFTAARERGLRD
jgi:hypothetical protein